MSKWRLVALTLVLAAVSVVTTAVAGGPPAYDARAGRLDDWRVVEDSLRQVSPKFREMWLRERGIELPGYTASSMQDSGLTLVGKWGRGPSVEVTGRDTLVVLTLGSEVALLSFADPDEPRVLSEIQFNSMTGQSQLVGSRLYVSSGRTFETWDVTDATSPVQLGSLPYGIGDFAVHDTLLYFILLDTFKVFSVADPQSMYQFGACPDSGYFLAATDSTVVLGHARRGLYLIDITDPGNPHRVGSFPSDQPLSAAARNHLVCVTLRSGTEPYPIRFVTIDISNPANPRQLGVLNDAGGYDLFLDGQYAFASGRDQSKETFHIISIADSAHPAIAGQCRTTNRYNWGVWASPSRDFALVADEYDGLAIVNISNPNAPALDGYTLVAASAEDISVDGRYCYVADGAAGMKVLDILEPSVLEQVGEIDTAFVEYWCFSATARDSFAYMAWMLPYLRTVDVTDPTNPRLVGGCPAVEGVPQDMVLRDSLLYLALDYQFAVVNIARPREPRVVGTLNLPERAREVILKDTLAYVATFAGVVIVGVARPSSPYTVGTWDREAYGIDLQDSLLYVVTYSNATDDVLLSVSVADPAAPLLLDSLIVPRVVHDVVVVDTIAYLGGYRCGLLAVDVGDPRNMQLLGECWSPPSWIRRIQFVPPYLYSCCTDGGVAILETLQTGMTERPGIKRRATLSIAPNVTAGAVRVEASSTGELLKVHILDVAGRQVRKVEFAQGQRFVMLDISELPGGVYMVRVVTKQGNVAGRVVLVNRR